MGIEIFETKNTIEKRRKLKKEQTKPEEIIWYKLRNRQFMGLKLSQTIRDRRIYS